MPLRNRLRIAIVRRNFSLRAGGAERYCVSLARQLARHGYDVTCVGERISAQLVGELDFLPVSYWKRGFTRTVAFAHAARDVVSRSRCDLVFASARFVGADIYRLTDQLHAHRMHVRYASCWARPLQYRHPRNRSLLALEREVFQSPKTRRFIVQSELDRRLVKSHYQIADESIRTVYNGVDLDVFFPHDSATRDRTRKRLSVGNRQPLVAFVSMGNLANKGLHLAIQALRMLKCRDARLLVVGGDSKRLNRYKQLAEYHGIGQRVIFLEGQTCLQPIYAAADLFVLPTRYEPFPNVNLESLACGCPVLTPRLTGTAEILKPGETGYILSTADAVGELAEAMDAHFELPCQKRLSMRAACRETAEKLSLGRHVFEIVDLIDDVLEEKSEQPERKAMLAA